MNDEKYYNSLDFISLGVLADELKDDFKLHTILSTFKCDKNIDLQDFLTSPDKAILLEKKHITRTYLYLEFIENEINVTAYFTVTIKVLETNYLSKSLIKKLDGIDKNRENIPCYLIAQLGKNSSCTYKIGQSILDDAIDTIKESNKLVGGRFIILDAINVKKVINFYTEEPNSFILLDKQVKDKENLKMYYPLI